MARAFQALGPVQVRVTDAGGEGGVVQLPLPWVHHMPLWANPLLQLESPLHLQPLCPQNVRVAPGVGDRTVWSQARWAEWGFGLLAELPGLRTVGDAVSLRLKLQASQLLPRDRWELTIWGRPVYTYPGVYGLAKQVMGDEQGLRNGIVLLTNALPASWQRAARQPTPEMPADLHPVQQVLDWVGWFVPRRPRKAEQLVSVLDTTVDAGTAVLMAPRMQVRTDTQLQYIGAANLQQHGAAHGVLGPAADAAHSLTALRQAMAALWRVQCDNAHKEVLWRLTAHGVRGAGGCGIVCNTQCACGWRCPGVGATDHQARAWLVQRHAFWSCPVAQAVVHTMDAALQAALHWQGSLACPHVWLLQPPTPHVVPGVWGVVCAAAVAAMDTGRKAMCRLQLAARQQPGYMPHGAATQGAAGSAGAGGAGGAGHQAARQHGRQLPLQEAWGMDTASQAHASSQETDDDSGSSGVAAAGHAHVHDYDLPVASVPAQAAALAVCDFWGRLQDIVTYTHTVPKPWRGRVAADHPFVGLQTGGTEHNGGWWMCLNMPHQGL